MIDITHDIAPHDVRAGGLALARSAPYMAPGIALAVEVQTVLGALG